MSKILSVLLFFLLSLASIAQKTIIVGVDTSHVGWQIAAFTPTDYISGKRILLAETIIGSGGKFNLELDVKETREVQLVVLHVQANMYAEPGKIYQITFAPDASVDFKRFDKTEVALDFSNLPADDLNNLIRQFDEDYYSFLNEHYYDFAVEKFKGNPEFVKRASEKSDADIYTKSNESDSLKSLQVSNYSQLVTEFFAEMKEKYGHHTNTFFREYMRYSLSEVEMFAGLPRKVYYQEYFMSQKMQLLNPAYMRAFKTFYHNLFTGQNNEKNKAIVKYVNAEKDPLKLVELFADDSAMLSKDIRALAVIKGLKDIYNNKDFSRSAIEKTLLHVNEVFENNELKDIATATIEQLKKNKEGWAQPDLMLLDEKEEKWQLAEYTGIPLYIIFFASWSNASVKEMLLLEKLAETYDKDIRIVAINMDEKYQDFKKYLYEHPKQKFTFLYGYGNILLKENFSLRTIPHAVMLDPDLKVMMNYTPLPSQGIQANFAKLKQQASVGGQGPKTWDKK